MSAEQTLDGIFKGQSVPEYDTVNMAMNIPQEEAIQTIKLASNTGMSLGDAASNFDTKITNNISANDLNSTKDTHPITASFLNNPIYLSSARNKEDLSSLMSIEGAHKHWESLKNGVKGIGYALAGTGKMISELAKEGSELPSASLQDKFFSFDNVKRAVSAWSNPLAVSALNQASTTALNSEYLKMNEIKSNSQLEQFVLDVEQNIPQLATQVAVSLATGGASSMLFMGSQIAGQQYADLKKENVSTEDAAKASLADAAIQMPLERIGLGKILSVAKGGVKQKLAKIAEASLTEGITEFLQQYPQDVTDLLAKSADKPLNERIELLKKDFGTMTSNAAYAGLIGGFMGGGASAIHVALQKNVLSANNEQLDNNIKETQNSPLLAKSPQTLADFKNQLAGDNKYMVDAQALQTYAQNNPNEKVLDKLGVNSEELKTAAESEQMIPVSVGNYEVLAAQSPTVHEALKNDVAFDEEGLTNNRAELLNSKEIIKQQEEMQVQSEELQVQKDNIYDNLRRTGLNDQETTSTLALLVSNAYRMNPDNPGLWLKEKAPTFIKGDAIKGLIHYGQKGVVENAKLDNPFITTKTNYDNMIKKDGKENVVAKLKKQGYDGIIQKGMNNTEMRMPFNQITNTDKQETKGIVSWDEEGNAYISLFKNSDMSTIVHEMVGHYFSQNLIEEGAKENAPDWMKQDRQKLLEYAGIDTMFEDLTREQKITAHEKWAEAAETYMLEGKAPNKELAPIFARFKKWLLAIYSTITRSKNGIPLNDDVRGVFDRMLAAESDVQQVEGLEQYLKKLPSDFTENLSNQQKTQLAKQIEKAHDKAVENVAKASLSDFTAERKTEISNYRDSLRPEAEGEIAKNNLYKATDALLEDNQAKDAKALAKKYTDLNLKGLDIEAEPLTDSQAMYLDRFDLLAESLGFSSGDELAQKIMSSPSKERAIRDFIDQKVNEKYPSYSLEKKARYESAKEALYNDESGLVLAEENKIIESKINETEAKKITAEENKQLAVSLRENMKLAAQDFLASKRIPDATNSKRFMTAERKAGEKSAVALAQKDYDSALQYKRVQLYNHSLVQESLRIKQEVNSNMQYLKRAGRTSMQTWKKEEHFAQAAALMERFGVIRKDFDPSTKTESLQEWATRINEMYDNVAIEPWLYSDKKAFIPDKLLTIGELTDVTNALKNIKKVAQDEGKFSKFMGERMADEVINKLVGQLSPMETVYTPEPGKDSPMSQLKRYVASLENRDTFLERLDGWKRGLFTELFGDTIEDRNNSEVKMKMDYQEAESQNKQKHFPTKEAVANESKKIYYDDLKTSVDKWTLIELALNTGSDSSKRVVFGTPPVGFEKSPLWVKGDAIATEDNVMKFLGKTLTANEWDYIQGAWNNMKFIWPLAQEVQKQATGFSNAGVKPTPFEITLANGTTKIMQGGYHPLMRDSRMGSKPATIENADDPLYKQNAGIRTLHTFTGYQKERTGATYPVKLSMNSRYSNVDAVLHDINFRLLVSDVRKIMNNEQFSSTLKQKLGRERFSAFKDYLATTANPWNSNTNFADETMGDAAMWLRNKTTNAAIMMNIKTSIQNLGNFALYANASEGFTYSDVLNGIGRAVYTLNTPTSWKNAQDFVSSKSIFMKERNIMPDFTVRDLMEEGKQNPFEKKITKWGTQMLVFTDNLSAIPMWQTAYEKYINNGKSEQDAVRFADSIVRKTLGSSRRTDVAPIIRAGKVGKLLTMFQTFFNTQYQQWAKETGIFLRDKDVGRLTAFVASKWLFFCFANMLTSLKNPFDEKDRQDLYSDLVTYPLTLTGPAGQFGSELVKRMAGFQSYGYRMSATQSALDTFINTGGKVSKVIQGKNEPSSLAEPVTGAVGLYYGVPAQFNKLFFNGYDILFNNMTPKAEDIVRRRPKNER